jgi:hypothetical protein
MGSLTSLIGGGSRAKTAVYTPPVRVIERVAPSVPIAATPDPAQADAITAEQIVRRRQGRLSTITTDERGVLTKGSSTGLTRKTLLGE